MLTAPASLFRKTPPRFVALAMCGDLAALKSYVANSQRRFGAFDMDGMFANYTALTGAAHTSLPAMRDIVAWLLDNGCNPHVPCKNQLSALMYTAQDRRAVSCLSLLLSRGASLAQVDRDGWNALHHAAAAGNEFAVQKLLDAGSAVNARANWEETALHLACGSGAVEAARLLLDRGADPDLMDDEGRTPFANADGPFCAAVWAHCLSKTIPSALPPVVARL